MTRRMGLSSGGSNLVGRKTTSTVQRGILISPEQDANRRRLLTMYLAVSAVRSWSNAAGPAL